jgi:hypothetical protein
VEAALATCPWPATPGTARAVAVRIAPAPEPPRRAEAAEVTPGPPPPPVSLDGKSLRLGTEKAAGFRRPVLADEGCLYVHLRGKAKLAGFENTVKLAVLRDGSVAQLSFRTPVDPEVEELVEEAFARCRWIPAADPQGTPLAVWVVMPLRIAAMPGPGEQP